MAEGQAAAVVPAQQRVYRSNVKPPKSVDISGDDKKKNWELHKIMWGHYETLSGLKAENMDQEVRKAEFMYSLGIETVSIITGLNIKPEDTVADIIKVIDKYCIGETHEAMEHFKFNQCDQKPNQKFDAWLAECRTLIKTCNFNDIENVEETMLRNRIIFGIRDRETQKKMLEERNVDLKRIIDIARSQEAATDHMKSFASKTEEVSRVNVSGKRRTQGKPSYNPKSDRPERTTKPDVKSQKCKFCMQTHPFRKELCPAWGRTCNGCHRSNHFKDSPVCSKNRNIHAVIEDPESESTDEELIMSVTELISTVGHKKAVYCEMLVCGNRVRMQIDCGATVNVIPSSLVPSPLNLQPTDVTLKMWNNTTMTPLGQCVLKVKNPKTKKKYNVQFVVVEEQLTPLLSRTAAEKMGLITINYEDFVNVNAVSKDPINTLSQEPMKEVMHIVSEYSDVFKEEVGEFKGEVHLTLRDDAEPVVCPARKVPIAIRPKLDKQLKLMCDQGIIEPIDKPTPWVSQMVTAEKRTGELRVCIDPKPLNEALMREHYTLPTLDDVLPELRHAKCFTKFDVRNAFCHCVLDEESSLLTTFQTHLGRFRWKRLPYGLKVSSEIFQKKLALALEGLKGIVVIADDGTLFGVGDTFQEALVDHNKKLRILLQRCRDQGIRLNLPKCLFAQEQISISGHLFTSQGVRPDPEKIRAIESMAKPKSVKEILVLQGTVNYLAKFLPSLSTVMTPILELTHKDVEWKWTSTHDKAFDEVKRLVTTAPVLAYYDPTKELVLQCDSSETGLGAALLQGGRPVAYASKALNGTQQRYAQIEKETMAILFGLEKFRQMTYGRETVVHSDHKPLETIIKKPLHKAPRRLQGMFLDIYEYNICIIWTPGNKMYIADMLSRAYLQESDENIGSREFDSINSVCFLPIGRERLEQIQKETESDESLQVLKQVIVKGWPTDKGECPAYATPYFHVRDELSIQDGLIMRGERVVIPGSMRGDMKKAVHKAHLGVGSCLRRARECLYWPGMSGDIKTYISTCEACRKFEVKQQKETLNSSEIPQRPWSKVGSDLFTFDNEDYLVTVDYYSDYWELDKMGKSVTSTKVINKLKPHFARHGIPDEVVSDGGPQYDSGEFKSFAKEWDFKHTLISPHHSKANGKVESAVKAGKRLLRKCKESGTDPYLAMLELRNTPTQEVGSSPVQRLYNRRTRTFLPTTTKMLKPVISDPLIVKEKLERRQDRQAKYYNQHAKDLPELKCGDAVRMKPVKLGEKAWKPATVTKELGKRSYQVRTPEGATYRRNRVDIRQTPETRQTPDDPVIIPINDITEPTTTELNRGDMSSHKPPAQVPAINPSEITPTSPLTTPTTPKSESKVAKRAYNDHVPNLTVTLSGRISKKPDYFNASS